VIAVAPVGAASLVGQVDPRVRLLCVLGASLWIAAAPRLTQLLALLPAALLLAVLARVPLRTLGRRLFALNSFMLLALLTLPFSFEGEIVARIGEFGASREGVIHALRIALTGNTLVLFFTALVATMAPVTLAHALLHLKVPDKLVRILMFAIRYVDVLHETRLRRERAMRARGFVARCNRHTLHTTAFLVGALVADSVARAQRIEQAMRCRGWKGSFPILHHFSLCAGDVAFGLLFGCALAILGVLS
jgi:cobalt/nickel transport system permease protein